MKAINYRLFLYQLIFASLVIFVHISFDTHDYLFDSIGRATVLLFFMVSSFFYCQHLEKEDYRYKSTLFRCLRLIIIEAIVFVIYFGISLIYNAINKTNPPLFSEFSFANIDNYFNKYCPKLSFMWFFHSLILCYLTFPLIYKIKFFHKKNSVWIAVAVLVCAYIFRFFAGKYDLGFFSYYESTRNFIITGTPCFLIGLYVYEHKDEINIYKNLSHPLFAALVIFLFGTTMLEAYVFNILGSSVNEFYLSSIALALIVFMHGVKYPVSKTGEFLYKFTGKEGITFIYAFHRMLIVYYPFNGALVPIKIILIVLSLLVAATIYHQIKIRVIKKKASQCNA